MLYKKNTRVCVRQLFEKTKEMDIIPKLKRESSFESTTSGTSTSEDEVRETLLELVEEKTTFTDLEEN